VTYERSISICYGLEPHTVQDSSHGSLANISVAASSSQADIRLHNIWVTAMATLTRQPLLRLDSSMRGPVGPLVQLFDRQICQTANEQCPKPSELRQADHRAG
jgi:hypothetical protein